jgi:site-specific DNA-methyltransferase (adenine-specific)
MNEIKLQDCLEGLKQISDKTIDICITSPPYNLNINYGSYRDNKPREEYLSWLNEIFIEILRVLKDDGHFWLNVGYSNIDPWVGLDVANVARNSFVLQNNFTWVKSITIDDTTYGNFKPINSQRFANTTWEHLFHFTKDGTVTCDKTAIGVDYMWDCNRDVMSRAKGRLAKKYGFKNIVDFNNNATDEIKKQFESEVSDKMSGKIAPDKRCRGNTWFIPYEPISNRDRHRGGHPATFPIKLVEQAIRFSGIQQGILLDPFMGSGTSACAAINLGLSYIGFEIDQSYLNFSEDRITDHKLKNLFSLDTE